MFDSNAELNIRRKISWDVWLLVFCGCLWVCLFLRHRQCCCRDVGVLRFTSVTSASRLPGNQPRVSVTLHSSTSSHTALLSGFRLLNSPSLLLCSEYGPCCFKNLSWIRLSLMELRGSVGSTTLGLKVVSAGESHRTSLQETFVTFFGPGRPTWHFGLTFKAHCRSRSSDL